MFSFSYIQLLIDSFPRANDGKIPVGDILDVSLAAKDQMEKAGLLSAEDLDGIKTFQDDLQVCHNGLNIHIMMLLPGGCGETFP